jgi:hypothetical protein
VASVRELHFRLYDRRARFNFDLDHAETCRCVELLKAWNSAIETPHLVMHGVGLSGREATPRIKPQNKMRTIKATFENGDHLVTSINGTDQEVREYYLGKQFNLGDGDFDNMQVCVKVEFMD